MSATADQLLQQRLVAMARESPIVAPKLGKTYRTRTSWQAWEEAILIRLKEGERPSDTVRWAVAAYNQITPGTDVLDRGSKLWNRIQRVVYRVSKSTQKTVP